MIKQPNFWDRYHEIGRRIAQCRKERNMTQEQFSEKLGISNTHLAAVEASNVKRKLSLDLLFNIADALNVEPKSFLESQEVPFTDVVEKDAK